MAPCIAFIALPSMLKRAANCRLLCILLGRAAPCMRWFGLQLGLVIGLGFNCNVFVNFVTLNTSLIISSIIRFFARIVFVFIFLFDFDFLISKILINQNNQIKPGSMSFSSSSSIWSITGAACSTAAATILSWCLLCFFLCLLWWTTERWCSSWSCVPTA